MIVELSLIQRHCNKQKEGFSTMKTANCVIQ